MSEFVLTASPVDRAKTGSKHHILTCANGFPLVVALSAANVNDHLNRHGLGAASS